MGRMKRAKLCRTMVATCGVALVLLGTGCGESTTPPTFVAPSTTIVLPAAQDDVAASWVMFFNGAQAVTDRIGLLENGQQYAQRLEALAASPQGSTMSVTIASVTMTSPTTADVKYSLLAGEQTLAPDLTGKAVLQDGDWKVSADSFLAVLTQLGQATTPTS